MESSAQKTMQEMFLQTQNICSWIVTQDMQLIESNCPEKDFFYSLFLISSCSAAIQSHFVQENTPLFVSDRTGLVWMAAFGKKEIHLLGPVFTSELTENHLRRLCRNMSLSPASLERLWKFIKNIPTISSYMASCYAAMLHYYVANSPVQWKDVQVQTEKVTRNEEGTWGDADWHGTWMAEQRLFESIQEGRYVDLSKITNGRVGNIGDGDPLRQAKNVFITFTMLCSRAAILGGVSPESALNLSDSFMMEAERLETVQEITALIPEMYRTFVRRVQKAKESQTRSVLVRACMDYVDNHIQEHISLSAISQKVGYHKHYISRTFKAETGESLVAYIQRCKIRIAKSLLMDMKLSIAEISDRLGFSSPSYFGAVFKKQTGISPAVFQQTQEQHPTESRFQSFGNV